MGGDFFPSVFLIPYGGKKTAQEAFSGCESKFSKEEENHVL